MHGAESDATPSGRLRRIFEPLSAADEAVVTAQLRRSPRGVAGVAHRCPCGKPAVVATDPRLPDATPFPTTYYLSCPHAVAACSRLESTGVMVQLTERVRADAEFARGYAAAHRSYLEDRNRLGEVPEIAAVSAGGMPDRVKCLHALVAHSLAVGPGVNPVGDDVLSRIGAFYDPPCLTGPDTSAAAGHSHTVEKEGAPGAR